MEKRRTLSEVFPKRIEIGWGVLVHAATDDRDLIPLCNLSRRYGTTMTVSDDKPVTCKRCLKQLEKDEA